jgi:hypothetical protein
MQPFQPTRGFWSHLKWDQAGGIEHTNHAQPNTVEAMTAPQDMPQPGIDAHQPLAATDAGWPDLGSNDPHSQPFTAGYECGPIPPNIVT